MNFFHAALLGLIQGTTEVLPISSSAHLILVPRLLGWAESGITFDVALHFGTFVALFTYFRRDVVSLVQDGLSGFFRTTRAGHSACPGCWWLVQCRPP